MEKLLNISQAAEMLGIKPVTLRLWISLKKIPYYKIGKCIKFKPSEIEAFINATRVEPGPYHADKKVASTLGIRYEKGRRQPGLMQNQREVKNGTV